MPIDVEFGADAGKLNEGLQSFLAGASKATETAKSQFSGMSDTIQRKSQEASKNIERVYQTSAESFKKYADAARRTSDEIANASQGYVDRVKSGYESVSEAVGKLASESGSSTLAAVAKIGTIGGAMAAGSAAVVMAWNTMQEAAKRYADEAADIADRKVKFDINTSAIQDAKGASVTLGISFDVLQTAMVNLSAPAGHVKATLEAMGIALEDENEKTKTAYRLFSDIAEKFQGYEDGARKAEIATNLFGAAEAKLIQALNRGPEVIQAYLEASEESGTKRAQAQIDAAEKQRAAMQAETGQAELSAGNIGKAADTMKQNIGSALAGNILDWNNWSKAIASTWATYEIWVEEKVIKTAKRWLGMSPPSGLQQLLSPPSKYTAVEQEMMSLGWQEKNAPPPPPARIAPPPQFASKDFAATIKEEQNEEENFFSWTAAKTADRWKNAYEWAKGYYGRETELSKELWAKYADAARAAQQKGGGGGGAAAPDMMGEFNAELQKVKDAEDNLYTWSKQREVEWWKVKLGLVKSGSAEEIAITHNIQSLRREIGKEDLQQDREIRSIQMDSARRHADVVMSTEENIIRTKRELGQISMETEAEMLRQSVERNFQAAKQIERDKKMISDLTRAEIERVNKEIERLDEQHNQRLIADQNRVTLEIKRKWDSIGQGIGNAFGSAVMGMINRTQTLRQTIANITQQMVQQVISKLVQMAVVHIGMEAARTGATVAGEEARLAAQKAGASEGLLFQVATNLKKIFNDAWTAAAAVFNWVMEVVPWPFSMVVAPIAGAAAFAAVAAFGSNLASAAGGWVIPSGLNPIVQAHAGEHIIPADIARRYETGSPGGGGLTLHIHANDARSFEAQLERSNSKLNQLIKKSYRDFALRPA